MCRIQDGGRDAGRGGGGGGSGDEVGKKWVGFDPTGLERAAKAARELDKSSMCVLVTSILCMQYFIIHVLSVISACQGSSRYLKDAGGHPTDAPSRRDCCELNTCTCTLNMYKKHRGTVYAVRYMHVYCRILKNCVLYK